MFDRRMRGEAATNGEPIQESAYVRAIDILNNHQSIPLPTGVVREMDEIVVEFQKEISGRLPPQ